ncbi:MAG: cytochrome c biogenesis protein CcsA [Betaproteobacteria bacterium]|nr:cytochrome c biogenesis protein CcsA [Betaproteobacteria bacterium]
MSLSWNEFPFIALPATLCWLTAGLLACRRARSPQSVYAVDALSLVGIILFTTFIAAFWNALSRPPLRTMGETRLWYALFLFLAGYITYRRWNYPWLLLLSAIAAAAFTGVNLLKPEIHSIAMKPALQSFLFIPHVIIYIIAYALFGVATLAACVLLVRRRQNGNNHELLSFIDNLIHIGFGFLAFGLLLGAVWAKEAWGHYWAWDPKETIAFITGAAYLVYIHLRHQGREDNTIIWTLLVAFLLLLLGWFGTTLFADADRSVHLYY